VLGALKDPGVIGGAFRVRLAASPDAGRYVRAMLGITGVDDRCAGGCFAVVQRRPGDLPCGRKRSAPSGGYPEIPLMEDVELSEAAMRRAGKTVLLPLRVESSAGAGRRGGPSRPYCSCGASGSATSSGGRRRDAPKATSRTA